MKLTRRWLAATTAAGMLTVLPACTSGTPGATASARSSTPVRSAPPASPVADPCRLVTQQDVASAVGGTVAAGQAGSFFGNPLCNFAVKGSNLGSDVIVQILIPLQYTRDHYDQVKAQTPTNTAVAGIGDDAFYDSKNLGVLVVKGKVFLEVTAQFPAGTAPPDPAKTKADVLAVATAAAANL